MRTVRTIVADWLKRNGYGGLYYSGVCGCELDDLMPCEESNPNCAAGYRVLCPGIDDCEVGGGCDFHITPHPPDEED